ncbi:MAG: peptide chain release factor N(5)-glutamine methyltransferase [Epsilonproteobacteria bacterium]|nr:peptide chain release factor N(5)-glutamine methyltransferase [Campylobacterota bacterium]
MLIKEAFTYLPRHEVEYILQKLLGVEKIFLHLHEKYEFDGDQFLQIVALRRKNYPLEYIFNEVEFYSQKFFIQEGVLIPRDDTEILIDVAKEELKCFTSPTIAEVGVGSGVICITLSRFIDAKFIATDINPLALEVTKHNMHLHNADIQLHLTNLLDNIEDDIDILISNPPYVQEDWHNDALKYEPPEALYAKDNGTYIIKQLIQLAKKRRIKLLICEIGYHQRDLLTQFLTSHHITDFEFIKDLNGNDRVMVVRFE